MHHEMQGQMHNLANESVPKYKIVTVSSIWGTCCEDFLMNDL